jgi:hypothetical protein
MREKNDPQSALHICSLAAAKPLSEHGETIDPPQPAKCWKISVIRGVQTEELGSSPACTFGAEAPLILWGL